jgi:hypothetical protein
MRLQIIRENVIGHFFEAIGDLVDVIVVDLIVVG